MISVLFLSSEYRLSHVTQVFPFMESEHWMVQVNHLSPTLCICFLTLTFYF
jgi:hypothetical protein